MIPRLRVQPHAVVRTTLAACVTTALCATLLQSSTDAGAPSATGSGRLALVDNGNPPTPGDFTGHGFDQCDAPTQQMMNVWLNKSPYLAVGIYISGDQRACREQSNLTPNWVATQLRKGWKLLPITLGPQASCQPRFPRYGGESIKPWPGKNGNYWWARQQGKQEAKSAVAAAERLGIVPGSTLFYDMEGFDYTNTRCRESALSFLHAWTWHVRHHGYLSGVYSSAGSGIKALEQRARIDGDYRVPDQIWIARWDGKANTSTTYISEEGWRPGGRLKQYLGGHRETYGGVTINIDSNWVDLGRGMYAPRVDHCNGHNVDRYRFKPIRHPDSGAPQRVGQIKTLQCFLKEAGYYNGPLNGKYNDWTRGSANRWRADHGFGRGRDWWRFHWIALLTQGNRYPVKVGSAGEDVRRVQRAMNAVKGQQPRKVDGLYTDEFAKIVNDYRERLDRKPANGIVDWGTWRALQSGKQ